MFFGLCKALLVALISHSSPIYAACPPDNFDAVQNFDIEKFVGERWYSFYQLPVIYQPEDQLYCVFADYAINTSRSLRCILFGWTGICNDDPPTISVFNSARRGSVTGRLNTISFEGTIVNPETDPAKAFVGPKFLPNFLRRSTNYWVVDVGTYDELDGVVVAPASVDYQWAIVTTATPSTEGASGLCYSAAGMWFFSRQPVPPAGTLEALQDKAMSLGLDTSVLLPVAQADCENDDSLGGFLGFLTGIF